MTDTREKFGFIEGPAEKEPIPAVPDAEGASLEEIGTVVDGIGLETTRAIEEGVQQRGVIENLSALDPETIARKAEETHLAEKLGVNAEAIRKLGLDTIKKIQDLVNVLGDSENATEAEKIMQKHGVSPDKLGSGSFYDTHAIEGGKAVAKNMKLNYCFSQERGVKMLAVHAKEAGRIREVFGDEFTPAAVFVYPDKMKDVYEAEAARIENPDVKLYPLSTFAMIQIDRRLQKDFQRRGVDAKRGPIDAAFGQVGEMLKDSDFYRKECAGVMVEERVHGKTFAEVMRRGERAGDDPKWEDLKSNAKLFLSRLSTFNQEYALLWHQLGDDNVVIETDEAGNLTGEIKIRDLNFTEKSAEFIRKRTTATTKEKIVKPLMEYFGFSEEEIYSPEKE
jgi:hypothetical protein